MDGGEKLAGAVTAGGQAQCAKASAYDMVEAIIAVAVGMVFAVLAVILFRELDYRLLATNHNFWFDSDPSRLVKALSDRWDWEHSRSNLHPLWSLFFATPILALGEVIGHPSAVGVYIAFGGLALGSMLYLSLRRFDIGRFDAILSSGLFLSTSTAWLWLGIPESFVLGAAVTLLSLVWLGARPSRYDSTIAVVQSVLSFSVTITNWVAGWLAAVLKQGWRAAVRTGVYAFAAGAFLAAIQAPLFPKTARYFDIAPEAGFDYGDGGSILDRLRAFFFHSLAAPEPALVTPMGVPHYGDRLSRMQFADIAHTPLAIAYLVGFGILFALGLRALKLRSVDGKLATYVFGVFGFNLLLHLMYGPETFLFAMHFTPWLVIIAAWSLATPSLRIAARCVMAGTIVLGVAHNAPIFFDLARWHNGLSPPVGYQPPDCGCSGGASPAG